MYLSVYQGINKIKCKEFDMCDEALEWLYAQMPVNAETVNCCFWNEDEQFVELEMRGTIKDEMDKEQDVYGWVYDQEML